MAGTEGRGTCWQWGSGILVPSAPQPDAFVRTHGIGRCLGRPVVVAGGPLEDRDEAVAVALDRGDVGLDGCLALARGAWQTLASRPSRSCWMAGALGATTATAVRSSRRVPSRPSLIVSRLSLPVSLRREASRAIDWPRLLWVAFNHPPWESAFRPHSMMRGVEFQ